MESLVPINQLRLLLITTALCFMPLSYAEENDCNSQGDEQSYLDNAYHYLNEKFCTPAVWFDNFFVDSRVTGDARAGTTVRWLNDFSYHQEDGFAYKTKVKFRLHLPKVNKKLKLVFEADAEDDLLNLFSEENVPAQDQNNSLGLRYDWYARGRSSFNIKVTIRPSVELRYRFTYPFSVDTALSFTQRVYQKKSVTGEISQFDLDHSLNQQFLLRWTNFAKYDNEMDHFELGTGFTLYQYFSDKRAINYKASVLWQDKPYHFINNHHLSLTYRQNILKEWLFYELTPEYNWPKEAYESRKSEAKFTLRLEVLFNNV